MDNRRWLLSRDDGAELEIIHDGHHIRAKPKGEMWSNQSFPSPVEAGSAVEGWLSHLFDSGWKLAAEGEDAELLVLWNRIAQNPALPSDTTAASDPEAEPERDMDWLKLRMINDALEPAMAAALAEQVVVAAPETLQLTNRKLLIDFSSIIESFAECPSPTVRRLIIDTLELSVGKQARFPWGDVGPLLSALPVLEMALLVGDVEFGNLQSESLVSLRVAADPILPATIGDIAEARCPSLRDLTLVLSCSDPAEKDSLRALDDLLESGQLNRLERLQLIGIDTPAAFIQRVADKPLVGGLKTLQISGAELEDEDISVPLLLEAAPSLQGIETLGLGIDVLSEEAQKELAVAIPGIADDFDVIDSYLPADMAAWAADERFGA